MLNGRTLGLGTRLRRGSEGTFLSTANQSLTSSGSEEHTKHIEAMTGDCATGNPGDGTSDFLGSGSARVAESRKVTRACLTDERWDLEKSQRSSVKHARVTFLDSATLAEPEPKKSEVPSKTK
jgi:hypothetical protein